MILRDPPGGLSSATYENIVTTTRLVQSATTVNANTHLGLTISAGASFEGSLCTGGGEFIVHFIFELLHNHMSLIFQYTGMGAIVLFCTEVGDAELEGSVPLSGDLNSDFLNEEYNTENSITTTWVRALLMCHSTIAQEISNLFCFWT
jgi:hypothetical protein